MEKDVAREGTYQVAKSPAHSAARRRPLCCPVSFRHWRAHFRNSVVAIERAGIWQLSLGCGVDSLLFHGGTGVRKCARRIVENSSMASAAFIRGAGGPRRVVWMHDCFCSSCAWRIDAACVANALELSADSVGAAFCHFIPDSARANDSDGFNAAGDDRRPGVATNDLWTRNRISVWLQHAGCSGGGGPWRNVLHSSIWTLRHGVGCGIGGLYRGGRRGAGSEVW